MIERMLEQTKKLIKLVAQLNKLALKVLELLGTLTLIALSIQSIAQIFSGG
jgi:hypothetical protein